MDGKPISYIERSMYDKQAALLGEARRRALVKAAPRRPRRPRRSWRTAVATVGRALVGFGNRLESLDRACDAGRVPALR